MKVISSPGVRSPRNYPYGIIESVANVFTSNLLNDCSFQITFILLLIPIWGSYFFVVTYQTSHGDDFVFEDSSLTSTSFWLLAQ